MDASNSDAAMHSERSAAVAERRRPSLVRQGSELAQCRPPHVGFAPLELRSIGRQAEPK